MNKANVEKTRVAIVGAGPAGVAAAVSLAQNGIAPVTLIDREPIIGGISARYTSDTLPTFVMWTRGKIIPGYCYSRQLNKKLQTTDVNVHLDSMVIGIQADEKLLTIVNPDKGKWCLMADAILWATGVRESSLTERGWIFGDRPSGMLYTSDIHELESRSSKIQNLAVAVVGSEITAYANSARLALLGAENITIIDNCSRPRCFWGQRAFFSRWSKPKWCGKVHQMQIIGKKSVESIRLNESKIIPVQRIVFCGRFLPNTEILAEAKLSIDRGGDRAHKVRSPGINNTGIFVGGNALDLDYGGQRAYYSGLGAARQIHTYLEKL